MTICENCSHRAVCSKYSATGGMNKCQDHAEERHGRWNGQKCSVCNESYMDYADADSYPAIGEPKPNYCPHCGTKMDANN